MSDLISKGVVALRADMAAGKLNAAELMQETLNQIAAVNPKVNAIVSLRDAVTLMAEARAADQAEAQGPLHGIPVAIKDLANAAGLPTTMGSPIFKDQVAARDDIMVARMRAAGAIIIGKTNTPEFGLGSHTFNPVHGATGNAYDPARSAGGSSGGAAVALATSMLSMADGSDMMGSLRNPAAWNNVYGMRPTWGLVPSEPVGDTFLHQLATNGPMGRSPADIALLLGVQAGGDPRQPHGLDAGEYSGVADLKGKRIGWLGDWGGAYPMEPGILDTCQTALATLAELGCEVESVALPFAADQIWQSWIDLRSWAVAGGAGALLANPDTAALLKPAAIWEIERGLALSAMDVHRASVIRSQWFAKAAALFDQFDALVLPSAQMWPFPVEWISPQQINDVNMDTYHRWMEVVIPISLLGLPCLNIPAGFGDNGLPMGLQLFGKRGADAALLQMGQAWHLATDWPAKRPPVL